MPQAQSEPPEGWAGGISLRQVINWSEACSSQKTGCLREKPEQWIMWSEFTPDRSICGFSFPHFHSALEWGWGERKKMSMEIFIFVFVRRRSYGWQSSLFVSTPSFLLRKAVWSSLVRNSESKWERLLVKASPDLDGLPANIYSAVLSKFCVRVVAISFILAGEQTDWESRRDLAKIKLQSYFTKLNQISHPVW